MIACHYHRIWLFKCSTVIDKSAFSKENPPIGSQAIGLFNTIRQASAIGAIGIDNNPVLALLGKINDLIS